MRRVKTPHRAARGPGERGIGVIAVLAIMVVLDLLLLVAARLAATAISSTFQDQSTTAAFHAAEAGLNHVMFAVNRNPDYDTGQRLPADANGDGRPDFGETGERGWAITQAAASANLIGLTSGEAVFIKPDRADGTRSTVMYAVGYIPNRAIARAVRVVKIVYTTGFVSRVAILTDGDLVISGNPDVLGTSGSVHANTNLSISGNPTVAGNATATGTFTQTGVPTIGGVSGTAPRMRMPVINLADYRPLADYELRANGRVYAGQSGAAGVPGTELADTSGGTSYRGWRRSSSSPVVWTVSGNTGYDGTYYVEGDATVSGNPGSASSPWRASIFAEGSIEISGNPVMVSETPGIGLVAGGDLVINGNPTQSYEGALLAREQVMISGNPTVTGFIIATNAASVSTRVSGASTIPGNVNITYNGGGAALPGGITVDAWQELISGLL